MPRIAHVDHEFNFTEDEVFSLLANNCVALLSPIIKVQDSSLLTIETVCTGIS
jgi:hypothetical protein